MKWKLFDGNEEVEVEGTWQEHCAAVRKKFDDDYENTVKPIIASWPKLRRDLLIGDYSHAD